MIGFIMQYQYVTTLRAGRVMGRVNSTPSLLRAFRENPSDIWPKCHHSSTCRVTTENWKNSRMRSAPDPYEPRRVYRVMTVCMAHSFNHISRVVGSKSVSRAGSDDIRRSSNCPSKTCDRLEVAISDRNVARLCVHQDPGQHCPLSGAVSDILCLYGLRLPETALYSAVVCGSSRLCPSRCYCPEINASGRRDCVPWSKRRYGLLSTMRSPSPHTPNICNRAWDEMLGC